MRDVKWWRGPFCPRPGIQKTVGRRAFGQFPKGLLGKNSVKLRAERTPKTSSDSDLYSRKQRHSGRYTCPVNRRVVGSSPTSGANQINFLEFYESDSASRYRENFGDPKFLRTRSDQECGLRCIDTGTSTDKVLPTAEVLFGWRRAPRVTWPVVASPACL
jgi:hypothetical protein